MKWAFKLLKIFGITIKVHLTFILLLIFIASAGIIREGFTGLSLAFFYVCLFITIIFHELGHSLMARLFKLKVQDITLLPIGGVARFMGFPHNPVHEILIAISGPLVSFVIAQIFLFPANFVKDIHDFFPSLEPIGNFLSGLGKMNLWIAFFNFIPAFPMDGGRVARSLLALKFEWSKATQIAALVGQIASIGFGVIGLIFNPWLLFVALFIYICAEEEMYIARLKSVAHDIPVEKVMITDNFIIEPDITVGELIDKMYHLNLESFLIKDDELYGIVNKDYLLSNLKNIDLNMSIRKIISDNFIEVLPTESLSDVMGKLNSKSATVAIVKTGQQILGIVTINDIIRSFLTETTKRRPPWQ